MRTFLLGAILLTLPVAGLAVQDAPAANGAAAYAWAPACRECHAAIHDAWGKTKHARTINRLPADQRQAGGECIGCHVTGPKAPVVEGTDVLNASVQCEACHGAARAHVESARAGAPSTAGLVKRPQEPVCAGCHDDRGPHFRGFYYAALAPLVHKH